MTSWLVVGLVWLLLAGLVGGWEWFALATGRPTLSRWVWHEEGRFPWFRWVILTGLLVLVWHFVFQTLPSGP